MDNIFYFKLQKQKLSYFDAYANYNVSMKLKTIKSKNGNPEYTQFLAKEIALIKKQCNINEAETVYFLCHHKWKQIFLINGIIYVANVTCELDKNRHRVISSMNLVELYKIKLYNKYPKTLKDISFEVVILKDPRFTFQPDEFFDWIDMPSEINEAVDLPYYKVIKFLNNYSKDIFRTERYQFYSKWDGDGNFITNIYAYDLKNQAEMKLYIPTKSAKIDGKWEFLSPETVKDVVIDDLSGQLSNYAKLQCKNEFLQLANEINPQYGIKNYWLMELVKLTIQPIDELHEWSIHRVFTGKYFNNIWVYDHPDIGEEPYFMLISEGFTKVAVINFKSPTYHIKGIYKQGNTKAKGWELTSKEIKELMYFLNSPSDRADDYGSGQLHEAYKKYVKTNWQQLIFEYNHNTAGWGWGDEGFEVPPSGKPNGIEQLPFDLPIPIYPCLIIQNY